MKVTEFMNNNPIVASPDLTIADVLKIMKDTGHDGFPVVNENKIVIGMVGYTDIILQPLDKRVQEIMQTRVVGIPAEMDIDAVARLMFRRGHSRFPVVDNEGHLLGLVTNMDVIRAHIERVTPIKVETLRKTLENLHNVRVIVVEEELDLDALIPTQGKIYKDELRAREYEIKLGLTEPLLVVKNGERLILVDGHHRAIAARNVGIRKMKSYVLKLESEVELGLEKTAEKSGLKNLNDIEILDGLSPYTLPVVLENGVVKRIV